MNGKDRTSFERDWKRWGRRIQLGGDRQTLISTRTHSPPACHSAWNCMSYHFSAVNKYLWTLPVSPHHLCAVPVEDDTFKLLLVSLSSISSSGKSVCSGSKGSTLRGELRQPYFWHFLNWPIHKGQLCYKIIRCPLCWHLCAKISGDTFHGSLCYSKLNCSVNSFPVNCEIAGPSWWGHRGIVGRC